MSRCTELRPKMLDLRYGLLDADEAGAVRAHVAGCKSCATAWAESGRQQKLIARAAKGVGPVVTFAAPDTLATPARPARAGRASFVGWAAVAAGLVLAVGVSGIPAARDVAAYSRAKPVVEREIANLDAAKSKRDKHRSETTAARTAAESEYASARKGHDELVAAWSAADKAHRDRPAVAVRGPAVPLSGAPNEYVVAADRPFEATVQDDAGQVVYTQTFPGSPKGHSLRLPPEAWVGVKPGADLFLHVSAVDSATGAKTDLADPVRLAGPTYTTFLTTDKPVYRPGEAVYFRSLTLDRARFLPPAKDVPLWFEVRSAAGKPVPGCELTGLNRPAVARRDGGSDPVLGPDGQPVRGVGTGAFALPAEMSLGEYTLAVYEATAGGAKSVGAKPQAVHRFVVRKPAADTRPVAPAAEPFALEFYPEGGDLVAGVPNRVYVRTGDGRPAEGVVTEGTREVARFKTHADPDQPGANRGLGEFTFTPEASRQYKAAGFDLPPVKADGVVLSVPDGVTGPGQPIRLTLASAVAKRSLWVGAYVRGLPVAHAKAVAEAGRSVDVTLQPADGAPDGVTRITVFEEVPGGVDKPVAERLVFRRPATGLKLGVAARTADGSDSFAPGDTVRLDVSAATEANEPTPAVLWAAVVRHSAATAAGPTHRSMPAHFYLAGEVRSPDELEHADFLLSDHPAAGRSLDLVLGTQGWRRFAEQAPEQFRAKSPADAEYLFAATGTVPVSLGRQNPAFDDYWPRYEAAHTMLKDARRRLLDATPAPAGEAEYAAARSAFLAAAGELDAVTHPTRRTVRTAVAVVLLVVGLGLLVARVRGPVRVAAVGCVALAAAVGLSLAATRPGGGWRETARVVAEDVAFTLPAPVLPSEELSLPEPPKGTDVVAKPDPTGGVMVPMTSRQHHRRSASLPPLGADAPPAARVRNEQPAVGQAFRWTPEFAELAKSPSAAEFCRRVMELAHATVPRTPPLVVREYAHRRTADGPDFAETLLWQPVLVVPGHGSATVEFALSDAETAYQILVAGHTLDGRIGAVTGRIEARKTGR
jgi:hypothetical protein